MFSLSLDVFSFICVENSTLDAWLDVYILVLRSALDNTKAISFNDFEREHIELADLYLANLH